MSTNNSFSSSSSFIDSSPRINNKIISYISSFIIDSMVGKYFIDKSFCLLRCVYFTDIISCMVDDKVGFLLFISACSCEFFTMELFDDTIKYYFFRDNMCEIVIDDFAFAELRFLFVIVFFGISSLRTDWCCGFENCSWLFYSLFAFDNFYSWQIPVLCIICIYSLD